MAGKILTSALFAGFFAGLVAAALQLLFVQPVLLHAELYESGELVHFGATQTPLEVPAFAFDPVRDGLSVLFTALIYTGYALLLVSGMAVAEMLGHSVSARSGILWGIAGFVSFQLAPAFGLPPELPGSLAAEVGARQVWWGITAAATAAAIWLIAYGSGWIAWVTAVALLLAPHLVGAPEVDGFAGPVPPELSSLFASRALGVGMASWVVLGLLAGWFWQRETDGQDVRHAT